MHMRFVAPAVLVLVAVLFGLAPAAAQQAGRWKVAEGREQASATLYSLNTLTTGTRTIDYRPALVLSCEARRYPVWRKVVQLRQTVSGDGRAGVTIRFDNGGAFGEEWVLAQMGRALQTDGEEQIARLTRARRFFLSWRFGVFAGRGEAVFDLAGIGETVARLAKTCGVDAP
ncbi:hypothetical protein RB623_03370 [Mesorhizobium sp. LHD-90]|uniref:hypothetical protein n=1 Tax=Mesorhizobium sp. LHD-90 TaxID=3071414 RepID=UPI0027DF521C|nr:hypothetical protein [Mesorhizobium sp. LHD-90]MDQ6433089.1 hypothetical protein [Mesorhizobium sp. LHD-90]